MVHPHPWFECRPALLITQDAPASSAAMDMVAVDTVWRRMRDADRHRFHRFTCEGDRSTRTIDVIYEMRAALAREGVE